MDILELDPESQKVMNAIEVDEYFERINKYLKNTFFYIVTYIKVNKYFEIDNLNEMCAQSRSTASEYLADVIKLMFLGYISYDPLDTKSKKIILGSKKIYDKINQSSWREKYIELCSLKSNHLKLSIDSRLNSVNGKNYLTRYKGETIEDIFKKNSEYIIEKITRGHFILSLESIEILEKKYGFHFSYSFKEMLKKFNLEHSKKIELIKSGKNFYNTVNQKNVYKNSIAKESNKRTDFIKLLESKNLPYSISNDEIIIEGTIEWLSNSELIDNLTINGNLIVNQSLKYPKIIPNNLNVEGYIRFYDYKFMYNEKIVNISDTFLKIE